jgi:hypothetical protein
MQRLQKLTVPVEDLLRNTEASAPDAEMLVLALEEIRDVCRDCDERVAIEKPRAALMDLGERLHWRPGQKIDLELDHPMRRLLKEEILQRRSRNRLEWKSVFTILMDHYLVMAKSMKEGRGLHYSVSKLVCVCRI